MSLLLKTALIMSTIATTGCQAPAYPTDELVTCDGKRLKITFFRHASIALETEDGRHIYVDPVADFADYASLPKADLILVTHHHYDHFDRKAIDLLRRETTPILCDATTAESLGDLCTPMAPGTSAQPLSGIRVEAVAAYNTSEHQLQFHPRERGDCGYVVTCGRTRIYIAGDTEPTPEMRSLGDIDIAFLPVNQPYTMTVGQAVEAVKALRPTVFYPYHYGQTDITTDIDRLGEALKGITEVRIRPLE